MKFEQAQENMIQQQIRAWEVFDESVLDLYYQIYRHEFVPSHLKEFAYADMMLPIGHGQTMLQPCQEGRILQVLQIKSHEKVLEVGSGTGFFTSLLAKLSQKVITIDIFEDFVENTKKRLAKHHIKNVECLVGDASLGWKEHAPYDVMVMTGSLPLLPEGIKNQIRVGGRLFVFLGQAPSMMAVMMTRVDSDQWKTSDLFETVVTPLIQTQLVKSFCF